MAEMTLIKLLESQIQESDTGSYEVGEQRERNMRYYSMQPLGNEQPGRSHYISPDVLDAVESKKAVFSETFLSNRKVVNFSNCPYPGEAEAKTAYVNQVFKRNKHEQLFRDGWHDAFVAKRMVVVGEWYKDTKQQEMQLQGVPAPMINQQLQQLGDQLVDVDGSQLQTQMMPSPQGPMQVVSGTLKLTLDDSYLRLQLTPPENFFRDPQAAYIEDSMWCSVAEEIPRGVLVSRGYDPVQVDELKQDYRFRKSEEDFSRKAHDKSASFRGQQKRAGSQELVTWFKTWTWLLPEDVEVEGFEPEEGFNLYEIHWCHGEVLRWEDGTPAIRVLDGIPCFEWSEMKVAHAENGLCTADVVAHIQKVQSGLKRLIYDNQQMQNSSRTLALSGALKNPRDLLDNKIGSTIWTKRMDAVMPLPTPQLSPMTFDVVQMFKMDSEERSGMSSLAKGMNGDAVKYQNADDMVARLTNAGTRRVTAAARDFANTFLIPLSQFIVRMGKEHDKSQSMMEIAGQQIPIIPAQWQDDDTTMDVAVALTPDEGAIMSNKLLTMHGVITQDPSMALSYGPAQKHALLDMIYDLMGVSDTSKILLAPTDPQYTQAAEQQQQVVAMEQQKQDALLGAQIESAKAQSTAILSTDRREWSKFSWDQTDTMHDNLLNERKQVWAEDIEQQEVDVKKIGARK